MNDHEAEPHEILRVGPALTLDLRTHEARRGERSARLPRTDEALLATLMRHPDRLFSQRELLQELWQGMAVRNDLYHRIANLRRALGTEVIRTVVGVGYQLGVRGPGRRVRPVLLQAGELRLLPGRQLTHGKQGPVDLTPREDRLMGRLMRRCGGFVTDEELMRAAGGAAGNNLRYRESLSKLRRKLQTIGAGHLLVFVEGGYRLAGTARLRRIAGLELDLSARVARLYGRPLALWPIWFALLERLAVAPGQSVSRAELLAHTWGADPPSESLSAIIAQLQRTLGPIGRRLIVSTADGYRLAIENFGLLAVGPLLLDPVARYARRDDREVPLSSIESLVLQALMRARGGALARERLLTSAGLEEPRAFEACVRTLRRKLRRLAGSDRDDELIVCVVGVGYRVATERLDADLLDWPLGFGELRFRPATRQLRCGTRVGTVGPKPATMLEHLILAAGQVVTDDVLIHALWDTTPGRQALWNCERPLQQALDEVGAAITVVRVRGIGYHLLEAEA